MTLEGIHIDRPLEYATEQIKPAARRCGRHWCHLWCEPGLEDRLHAVAKMLGLKRHWFQERTGFSHYDLTKGKFIQACKLGVQVADLRDWVTKARQRDGIGVAAPE